MCSAHASIEPARREGDWTDTHENNHSGGSWGTNDAWTYVQFNVVEPPRPWFSTGGEAGISRKPILRIIFEICPISRQDMSSILKLHYERHNEKRRNVPIRALVKLSSRIHELISIYSRRRLSSPRYWCFKHRRLGIFQNTACRRVKFF